MANDPAIGIIGALNEAGLLRTAPSTSEPAAQVIFALREAGLLRTAPSTPEPPPPPGPKVGEEVYLGKLARVTQFLGPAGAGKVVLASAAKHNGGNFYLDFPPNDEGYLPLIDKLIAAPKDGLSVMATVEITSVAKIGEYGGILKDLRVDCSFSPGLSDDWISDDWSTL